MGLRDYPILKKRLRGMLAWLSEEQQSLADQLQPQSLEDVDMLREKLQGALEELAARRRELERQREQANQGLDAPGPEG